MASARWQPNDRPESEIEAHQMDSLWRPAAALAYMSPRRRLIQAAQLDWCRFVASIGQLAASALSSRHSSRFRWSSGGQRSHRWSVDRLDGSIGRPADWRDLQSALAEDCTRSAARGSARFCGLGLWPAIKLITCRSPLGHLETNKTPRVWSEPCDQCTRSIPLLSLESAMISAFRQSRSCACWAAN